MILQQEGTGFKMEYDAGVRFDAILENQEKMFKIEQYKVNLLEAIAKELKIDLTKITKEEK